jgi:hypothetical protein
MTGFLENNTKKAGLDIPFPFGTYLTNDTNLVEGQAVKMTTASYTVQALVTGTDFPIGVVMVTPDRNGQLTVAHTSILGFNTSIGTTGLAVGSFVNTIASENGEALFVALAAPKEYATGIIVANLGEDGTHTRYKVGLIHPLKQ